MPTLLSPFTLEINPKKFLTACSDKELAELQSLIPEEITRRQISPEEYPQPGLGKVYMTDPKDFNLDDEPENTTEHEK